MTPVDARLRVYSAGVVRLVSAAVDLRNKVRHLSESPDESFCRGSLDTAIERLVRSVDEYEAWKKVEIK